MSVWTRLSVTAFAVALLAVAIGMVSGPVPRAEADICTTAADWYRVPDGLWNCDGTPRLQAPVVAASPSTFSAVNSSYDWYDLTAGATYTPPPGGSSSSSDECDDDEVADEDTGECNDRDDCVLEDDGWDCDGSNGDEDCWSHGRNFCDDRDDVDCEFDADWEGRPDQECRQFCDDWEAYGWDGSLRFCHPSDPGFNFIPCVAQDPHNLSRRCRD